MSSEMIKVASLAELQQRQCMLVSWQGQAVLLAYSQQQVRAVSGLCPHEDYPLDTGYVKDDCIHCSLHGSYFNLESGRVMADPAEQDLQVYAVAVQGDDILLGGPLSSRA